MEEAQRRRALWPACSLMSLCYLASPKPYNILDSFQFNGLAGETVIIRNMGWQFFVKANRKRIKERIVRAVMDMQASCDVIGLGALTKAEWLTQGGQWVVDRLGDKLRVPVVHGDTLTAAVVVKQVERLTRERGLDKKIFITGSTSKIGRAAVLALARKGYEIRMFTTSQERFERIRAEAGAFGERIKYCTFFMEGADCSLWITGKAIPGGDVFLKHIPENGVVLNFSVPNPVSPAQMKGRPDLDFVEAGLLAYDGDTTDLKFTMRLPRGITYACHAGTMVHAAKGWSHHEVSQVNVEEMEETWQGAMELGFDLPEVNEKRK